MEAGIPDCTMEIDVSLDFGSRFRHRQCFVGYVVPIFDGQSVRDICHQSFLEMLFRSAWCVQTVAFYQSINGANATNSAPIVVESVGSVSIFGSARVFGHFYFYVAWRNCLILWIYFINF